MPTSCTRSINGGDRRTAAQRSIAISCGNEPFDRGWYASPIGWVGSGGAEMVVGIRSALRGHECICLPAPHCARFRRARRMGRAGPRSDKLDGNTHMNITWAKALLEVLTKLGAEHVCIGSGPPSSRRRPRRKMLTSKLYCPQSGAGFHAPLQRAPSACQQCGDPGTARQSFSLCIGGLSRPRAAHRDFCRPATS